MAIDVPHSPGVASRWFARFAGHRDWELKWEEFYSSSAGIWASDMDIGDFMWYFCSAVMILFVLPVDWEHLAILLSVIEHAAWCCGCRCNHMPRASREGAREARGGQTADHFEGHQAARNGEKRGQRQWQWLGRALQFRYMLIQCLSIFTVFPAF